MDRKEFIEDGGCSTDQPEESSGQGNEMAVPCTGQGGGRWCVDRL